MNAFDSNKTYKILQVIFPNGEEVEVNKIVSGIQRHEMVYTGIDVTTKEAVKWNARCSVDYVELSTSLQPA